MPRVAQPCSSQVRHSPPLRSPMRAARPAPATRGLAFALVTGPAAARPVGSAAPRLALRARPHRGTRRQPAPAGRAHASLTDMLQRNEDAYPLLEGRRLPSQVLCDGRPARARPGSARAAGGRRRPPEPPTWNRSRVRRGGLDLAAQRWKHPSLVRLAADEAHDHLERSKQEPLDQLGEPVPPGRRRGKLRMPSRPVVVSYHAVSDMWPSALAIRTNVLREQLGAWHTRASSRLPSPRRNCDPRDVTARPSP